MATTDWTGDAVVVVILGAILVAIVGITARFAFSVHDLKLDGGGK
jgi:hypothetical protein